MSMTVSLGVDLSQLLLEPEVGVRVCVERSNLDVPRASIEADRFGECAVRFELNRRGAKIARFGLERDEHAPAQTDATRRVRDPHPLERSNAGADQLHRTTCDRLAVDTRHEERA